MIYQWVALVYRLRQPKKEHCLAKHLLTLPTGRPKNYGLFNCLFYFILYNHSFVWICSNMPSNAKQSINSRWRWHGCKWLCDDLTSVLPPQVHVFHVTWHNPEVGDVAEQQRWQASGAATTGKVGKCRFFTLAVNSALRAVDPNECTVSFAPRWDFRCLWILYSSTGNVTLGN